MYYDGAGCGVFQVRANVTKEKGVHMTDKIGEYVFSYIQIMRKEFECALGRATGLLKFLLFFHGITPFSGAMENPRSPKDIWEELRKLSEIQFRFAPLSDPVGAVQTAGRNALLYPGSELLVFSYCFFS